jgi:hypothetical protein
MFDLFFTMVQSVASFKSLTMSLLVLASRLDFKYLTIFCNVCQNNAFTD